MPCPCAYILKLRLQDMHPQGPVFMYYQCLCGGVKKEKKERKKESQEEIKSSTT